VLDDGEPSIGDGLADAWLSGDGKGLAEPLWSIGKREILLLELRGLPL
jgi:hypothetical protein